VKAVTGSDVLPAGLMRRMIAQENIIESYKSRRAAMDGGNVAEWAKKNKQTARLLSEVEKILNAKD